MPKMTHLMIDLETMGTTPDQAIVSIGACPFDPNRNQQCTDKNSMFYMELDWEDQERYISPDTRDWWGKQSFKARECLEGFETLREGLTDLSTYIAEKTIGAHYVKVWGNGATFDIGTLEHAYRSLCIPIPWEFWNIRDCRTVKDMFESKRAGLSYSISNALAHNALEDAIYQAKYIRHMWQKILKGGK